MASLIIEVPQNPEGSIFPEVEVTQVETLTENQVGELIGLFVHVLHWLHLLPQYTQLVNLSNLLHFSIN